MRWKPTDCSFLTLLFVLALVPFPLAAQDGCFTCDTETRNCKEAAKLGFEECVDGTRCGAEGCLDFCIAGPNKCAEIVPFDPPEALTSESVLACEHRQPRIRPADSSTPVACHTPNGAPVGSCLRAMV